MEPRLRRQNAAPPPRGPAVPPAQAGSHSRQSSSSKREIWDGSFIWKVRANKTVYNDRVEYNQTIDCKFFCKLSCYKEANVDTSQWLSVMQLVPLPDIFRRELIKGYFASTETSTKLLISFTPNSNLHKFNVFMRSSRRMMMLQTTSGPNTSASNLVFMTHDTGRKEWIIFSPNLRKMPPMLFLHLPSLSTNPPLQSHRNIQAVLGLEVEVNAVAVNGVPLPVEVDAQQQPSRPIVRLVGDPQRQFSVCVHRQPRTQRLQPSAIVFPSQPAPGGVSNNIAVIDLRGLAQGALANNNQPQQAPVNPQRPPAQQVVAQQQENARPGLLRRIPRFVPYPNAQRLLVVPRPPQAPVRIERPMMSYPHQDADSGNQEACVMDMLDQY